MKKIWAVVAVVLSLCVLVPQAFAAETKTVTIKKVNAKASSITVRAEGAAKDEVLTVDKSVDLKTVKAKEKVQITVDGKNVTEIKAEEKPAAPAAAPGAPAAPPAKAPAAPGYGG